MTNEKVFAMSFAKVYPMLIAKAERKGRTCDEVLAVTTFCAVCFFLQNSFTCISLQDATARSLTISSGVRLPHRSGEVGSWAWIFLRTAAGEWLA